MKTTVIICAHNPREEFLTRVLEALRKQTLALEAWELLLVDNKSSEPLCSRFDLTWHPNSRHVREDELGLIPARLRGIAEANGEVIVFVDDDNVLGTGYLAEAIAIGKRYPFLGAWGSGAIDLEYEVPPPAWIDLHKSYLAYRTLTTSRWSNIKGDVDSQPVGAGMCVRREVGRRYAAATANDTLRRSLGRRGTSLLAGDDFDLALTSAELGYGWGNFPSLSIVHLIPARRMEESYLLRLREEIMVSNVFLAALNGYATPRPSSTSRFLPQYVWRYLRWGPSYARVLAAERRGLRRGLTAAKMQRVQSGSTAME